MSPEKACLPFPASLHETARYSCCPHAIPGCNCNREISQNPSRPDESPPWPRSGHPVPTSGEGNHRMQKIVPRHRVRGCNFTQTNGGTLWNHTVAEAEGCSLLASRFSVPVTRKPRALWQRHLGRIISPNQSRFLGPPGGCRLTLYACAACAARGDLRIAFESRALKKVPEMSRRKTKKIKNLLTRNRARRPSPGGGGALISSGKSLFFINNLCHPMDMMTMIWPRRDRCLGLESE